MRPAAHAAAVAAPAGPARLQSAAPRPFPPLPAAALPHRRGEGWAPPPPAASLAEERLYRQQRLAAAFRLFGEWGYDMGGAGHITARDPEYPDHFWVNPAGVAFSQIRVSDLMLVSHDGEIVVAGAVRRLNRAAFAIHSVLHAVRPDVIAAAHSHSLYGKAWSALGRLLDPITQDSCAFYNCHAVFADFAGVVLDTSEGEKIAQALGSHVAVILQNHGLLTVGPSVESAVWRYRAMDNAAQAQLLAQAAGTARPVPHAVAELTAGQMGSDVGTTYAFHPYFDMIARAQPDLFD